MKVSYNEWIVGLEPVDTIEVNRNLIRDIYKLPNNVRIIENTDIPWNIFKNITTSVLVDLIFKVTDTNIIDILNKYNGIVESDMGYLEEGYFNPYFKEIYGELPPIQRAFEFVNELDNLNLINL